MTTAVTRAAPADLSLSAMLAGNQILEVADNRQITLRADGQVTSASLSPDGRYVAYAAKKQDITNLCLPDGTVFFRPGTQDNIFKYIDPGVEKHSDIADGVIGELDAGYNWKILIFADTHTEVKLKQ